MPKRAVALFFLLAFVGAGLFIFFTFPRTKDQIPASNNQRPFPSAPPEPGTPNTPNGPNKPDGVPVPESVPHPNTPKVPPGPTLRVMAWANAAEARRLSAEADSFGAATGRQVSLTVDSDSPTYRRDLQQALASGSPPDLCLVSSRDFSGLDPAQDLADVSVSGDYPSRAIAAFTVNSQLKAVPGEFTVDVLFYNTLHFDQAGIGYPGRHWNWDILEADSRAISTLSLKDPSGRPTFPLEAVADFDLWNILCTQAGHPALDSDTWHLGDVNTKESQLRALDVIHEIFQDLTITAPSGKAGDLPGHLFAQQRASLLIAPSDIMATLPAALPYAVTFLPKDLRSATLACVNGWAVTAKSTQGKAAQSLAQYLADGPVHAGWTSVRKPHDATVAAVCYEALSEALIPRLEPKAVRFAQFLDKQIDLLAHTPQQTSEALYTKIQSEYQGDLSAPAILGGLPGAHGLPTPKAEATSQLRGF